MPISQLTERCWVLDVPKGTVISTTHQPDTADDEHWDKEQDAREAAGRLGLGVRGRQLEEPCWVIRCGGDCDVLLDEEDECYIFHSASRAEAEKAATDYGWTVTRDGEVFCDYDAPDCSAADLAVTEQIPGQLTIEEARDAR